MAIRLKSILIVLFSISAIKAFTFPKDSYQKFRHIDQYIKEFHVQPKWAKDNSGFHFFDHQKEEVHFFDFKTFKTNQYLSLKNLEVLKSLVSYEGSSYEFFRAVDFVANKQMTLEYKGEYIVFNLSTLKVRFRSKLLKPTPRIINEPKNLMSFPEYEVVSPDNKYLVTLTNNELALRLPGSETTLKINVENNDVKRFNWAFYSVKWLKGSDYFIITNDNISKAQTFDLNFDWSTKRPTTYRNVPYTSPTDKMTPYELYIVNTKELKANRIIADNIDKAYYEIREKTSNTSFIFSVVNRLYSERRFYHYDIDNGTRFIFKETFKTYLMDNQIGGRGQLLKSYKGKNYLHFLSEKSGRTQIYKIDLISGKRERLTNVKYVIDDILSYNDSTDSLYFTAFGEDSNPYHLHIYKYTNGELKRLSKLGYNFEKSMAYKAYNGQGLFDSTFISPDFKVMVTNFSNLKNPMQSKVINLTSNKEITLGKADVTELLSKRYRHPIEVKAFATDKRTELFGQIYLPSHFDKSKKYPIIDFIYGGPQLRQTSWSYFDKRKHFAHQLSELGFIVLMMDARGTPDRGKDFQDFNYKKFGQLAVYDHKFFIQQIAKKYKFIDLSKTGVIGSSYGGFQTLNFITREPDFFKVAVANAAVADIRDVHSISSMMYMGDPKTNMDAYEQSSVFNQITNLKAKLLILHGARDINAPLFGMMKLMQKMVENDIYFDQFIDPITAHSRREYTWEKMARYFHDHLSPNK